MIRSSVLFLALVLCILFYPSSATIIVPYVPFLVVVILAELCYLILFFSRRGHIVGQKSATDIICTN